MKRSRDGYILLSKYNRKKRKLARYWNREVKKLKRKDTGEVLLAGDCNEKNTIVIKSVVIPLAIGKLNNNNNILVELDIYKNI